MVPDNPHRLGSLSAATPKKKRQRKQQRELSSAERERRRRQAQMAAQNEPVRRGFRISEFARRNGVGRQFIYNEINAGRLKARKAGRATIVTSEDEQEWLDSLPLLEPNPSAA